MVSKEEFLKALMAIGAMTKYVTVKELSRNPTLMGMKPKTVGMRLQRYEKQQLVTKERLGREYGWKVTEKGIKRSDLPSLDLKRVGKQIPHELPHGLFTSQLFKLAEADPDRAKAYITALDQNSMDKAALLVAAEKNSSCVSQLPEVNPAIAKAFMYSLDQESRGKLDCLIAIEKDHKPFLQLANSRASCRNQQPGINIKDVVAIMRIRSNKNTINLETVAELVKVALEDEGVNQESGNTQDAYKIWKDWSDSHIEALNKQEDPRKKRLENLRSEIAEAKATDADFFRALKQMREESNSATKLKVEKMREDYARKRHDLYEEHLRWEQEFLLQQEADRDKLRQRSGEPFVLRKEGQQISKPIKGKLPLNAEET